MSGSGRSAEPRNAWNWVFDFGSKLQRILTGEHEALAAQPEAPLSEWKVIDSSGSRSSCDSLRTYDVRSWLSGKGVLELSAAELNRYVNASRGVSTDDPRLKGK